MVSNFKQFTLKFLSNIDKSDQGEDSKGSKINTKVYPNSLFEVINILFYLQYICILTVFDTCAFKFNFISISAWTYMSPNCHQGNKTKSKMYSTNSLVIEFFHRPYIYIYTLYSTEYSHVIPVYSFHMISNSTWTAGEWVLSSTHPYPGIGETFPHVSCMPNVWTNAAPTLYR